MSYEYRMKNRRSARSRNTIEILIAVHALLSTGAPVGVHSPVTTKIRAYNRSAIMKKLKLAPARANQIFYAYK